jgi:signal transduction histidine kinase
LATSSSRRAEPRPGAGLVALAVGLVGALALAVLWMRAPGEDVRLLALYLVVSGALSLGLGRLGLAVLARLGVRLGLKIAFGQLLVIVLVYLNVVITALLMFISAHDLALLGLLMLFAAVLGLFFASALADSVVGGLGVVSAAARRMAAGDLTARASLADRGEVGELARAFDEMAGRLDAAARERAAAEASRRGMVAAVSHDLRTPLASIRAMVEAIVDGVVADEATVRRYLETIGGEVNRLARLIDDLFELSQIDAGQLRLRLERGSLHDLISDTLRSAAARAASARVGLVGEVDAALPPVRLDPARVQRVLDNLIANALRHTPPGGRVELSAVERADEVEVAVTDSGEGIADGELERVFDSFYRGERERSRSAGAGLGLTIARSTPAGARPSASRCRGPEPPRPPSRSRRRSLPLVARGEGQSATLSAA